MSLLPPAGETSLLLRFLGITLRPLDNLPIVRLLTYLHLQSPVTTYSQDPRISLGSHSTYHIREEELDSTFRQGAAARVYFRKACGMGDVAVWQTQPATLSSFALFLYHPPYLENQ